MNAFILVVIDHFGSAFIILDKLPLVEYRRKALMTYKEVSQKPFEFSIVKGLVVGFIMTCLCTIYCITANRAITYYALSFVFGPIMGFYIEYMDMDKVLKKSQREIGIQFSRFASNCVLFISAGLSIRRAFQLSSNCLDEGLTKKHIQSATQDLEMNINTSEVFETLNAQLRHPVVSEFTSVLQQHEKYGSGTKSDLHRVIRSAWQSRKDTASVAAKEMETKLVFPSMLIFLGVMLMVLTAMLMQLMTL